MTRVNIKFWSIVALSLIACTELIASEKSVSVQDSFDRAGTEFARNLANDVTTLLFDSGCIDRTDLTEDKAARKRIQKRQREVYGWFVSKGKSIQLSDCRTETDKSNYLEFRDLMASREFLSIPYKKRLKFIQSVQSYFDRFEANFSSSMTAVLSHDGKTTSGRHTRFLNTITAQLQQRIAFEFKYFNSARHTSIGALYIPAELRVFLNLNAMMDSPADFIDALEHELWHHLLPPSKIGDSSRNLWWEGFTEAISEIWSHNLNRNSRGSRATRPSDTIQYPVQTAFASLFLGTAMEPALYYLTGITSADEFLEDYIHGKSLEDKDNAGHPKNGAEVGSTLAARNRSEDQVFRAILAGIFLNTPKFDKAKEEKVEKLLRDWGWKEDNRTPLKVSQFLDAGKLSEESLTRTYQSSERLLTDLIEAVTVINMQNLGEALALERIRKGVDLPPYLRANLVRVLKYSANPYHQLANH